MNRRVFWAVGLVAAAMAAMILPAGAANPLEQADDDLGAALAQMEASGELAVHEGPWANRPLGKLIRERLRLRAGLRGELNLTEDQKLQIGKVLKGHKAEIVAALTQLRDQHRKLEAAVIAQPTDEKAIREAAADLAKAIGDAAVLKAKVRHEVRAALTDAQKARLDQFRADMRAAVDRALAEAAGD